MIKRQRALVGMSGGVDSSVAAMLLIRMGYEVSGATFQLWKPDAPQSAFDDISDAREVCNTLGIPHYVLDYRDIFKEKVVGGFTMAYQSGQTPNPCVICNKLIKFGAFWQYAKEHGFDYIATGHYANVEYCESDKLYSLKSAAHAEKDQSYVLYHLSQEVLSHTLMPLGKYSKDEIRDIAKAGGLKVGDKADSQDICFIPDGDYSAFLERHTGMNPAKGSFVDKSGNILGEHMGIWNYTVGQRKGLGVSFGKPLFVLDINANANTVTLGENEELFKMELSAYDVSWISGQAPKAPLELQAKIRYSQKPASAVVTMTGNDTAKVVFAQPQRAITEGQAVVFYDGGTVKGGGTIRRCG